MLGGENKNRHGHMRAAFMVKKHSKTNPLAILDAAMEQDADHPDQVLIEKEIGL